MVLPDEVRTVNNLLSYIALSIHYCCSELIKTIDWKKNKSLTKISGGRELGKGGYKTQYCSGAVRISK